jgi:hypothetical protein
VQSSNLGNDEDKAFVCKACQEYYKILVDSKAVKAVNKEKKVVKKTEKKEA